MKNVTKIVLAAIILCPAISLSSLSFKKICFRLAQLAVHDVSFSLRRTLYNANKTKKFVVTNRNIIRGIQDKGMGTWARYSWDGNHYKKNKSGQWVFEKKTSDSYTIQTSPLEKLDFTKYL